MPAEDCDGRHPFHKFLPRVLSVRRPPDADGAGAFFLEDDMRNTTTTVVIAARAVLAFAAGGTA